MSILLNFSAWVLANTFLLLQSFIQESNTVLPGSYKPLINTTQSFVKSTSLTILHKLTTKDIILMF